MTLHLVPVRKRRNVTETRLRLGAVVLKTASPDAKHGAFWTYPDTGKLADANVCARLERMGLLESEDGLLPGGGQTYRLKPVPPEARRRRARKADAEPQSAVAP